VEISQEQAVVAVISHLSKVHPRSDSNKFKIWTDYSKIINQLKESTTQVIQIQTLITMIILWLWILLANPETSLMVDTMVFRAKVVMELQGIEAKIRIQIPWKRSTLEKNSQSAVFQEALLIRHTVVLQIIWKKLISLYHLLAEDWVLMGQPTKTILDKLPLSHTLETNQVPHKILDLNNRIPIKFSNLPQWEDHMISNNPKQWQVNKTNHLST